MGSSAMARLLKTAALFVVALAIGFVAGRSVAPPRERTWHDVEVDAGLDRPIRQLHADHTPLREVIQSLADQAHANVVVNWPALEAAGIDDKVAVDLRLDDLPLRTMLARTLEHAEQGVAKL